MGLLHLVHFHQFPNFPGAKNLRHHQQASWQFRLGQDNQLYYQVPLLRFLHPNHHGQHYLEVMRELVLFLQRHQLHHHHLRRGLHLYHRFLHHQCYLGKMVQAMGTELLQKWLKLFQ